jgi:hypothetical protein
MVFSAFNLQLMAQMSEDAILQVKYTGQYAGPQSRWCGGSVESLVRRVRGVVGTAGLLSRRHGGDDVIKMPSTMWVKSETVCKRIAEKKWAVTYLNR